jgi:hypothetical protein
MAKAKKDKLIEEAKKRFKAGLEAEEKNRRRALEAIKFRALQQWPDDVKNARENDKEGARPCLVVDKINQYIRQVVNDERQNRPAIKVRPVDDQADPEVAEVLQGIVRHIEDASSADIAYDTAFEHAVDGGYGYWRIVTDYTDELSFEQDIRIRRVRNRFSVVLDHDSMEPDGSDAKWAFVYEDISREDFKKKYPDADVMNFKEFGTGQEWNSEDKVRIAEYFRIEPHTIRINQMADGTILTDDELAIANKPAVASRETTINVVKWSKLSAAEELESRDWAGKYIPVVRVIGNEIDMEGELRLSGAVESAMDAQRMVNYSSSAFVEMVALAPKAPFIAAKGQIEGNRNDWATANRRNIAVLEYEPQDLNGSPVPPPIRQPMPGIPAGWAQAVQLYEHDIQSAMGMYSANVGAPSNEKSGRAILARQREGDVGSFHYVDNLSRSIRHTGRILIDLIPKIYDTPRIARIIGVDGESKPVRIDPNMESPKTEQKNELGKVVGMIYNLDIGKYDVMVSVGPSYSTKRQESAEWMSQMVQAKPELMQVVGDIMFRNFDMPGADDIADRLKKLLPPLLQENDDEGEPDPRMAKFMMQAEQVNKQLEAKAAGIQQGMQDLAAKQAELDDLMVSLQSERKAMDTDRKVMMADAARLKAEIALRERVALDRVEDEIEGARPLENDVQQPDLNGSIDGMKGRARDAEAFAATQNATAQALSMLASELSRMNQPRRTVIITDENGEPIGTEQVPLDLQ